jgi:hypothetical protein
MRSLAALMIACLSVGSAADGPCGPYCKTVSKSDSKPVRGSQPGATITQDRECGQWRGSECTKILALASGYTDLVDFSVIRSHTGEERTIVVRWTCPCNCASDVVRVTFWKSSASAVQQAGMWRFPCLQQEAKVPVAAIGDQLNRSRADRLSAIRGRNFAPGLFRTTIRHEAGNESMNAKLSTTYLLADVSVPEQYAQLQRSRVNVGITDNETAQPSAVRLAGEDLSRIAAVDLHKRNYQLERERFQGCRLMLDIDWQGKSSFELVF